MCQWRFTDCNLWWEMLITQEAVPVWGQGYTGTLFSTQFCDEPKTALKIASLNIWTHAPEKNLEVLNLGYMKTIFYLTVEIPVNSHAYIRSNTERSHVSSTQFPSSNIMQNQDTDVATINTQNVSITTMIPHRLINTRKFALGLGLMEVPPIFFLLTPADLPELLPTSITSLALGNY